MKRLLGNLALSLAVSALMLAGLEGGARLVERSRPRPVRPAVAEYIWDWDDMMPGGFYVMKSDAAGWPPWEEFNRDGLRDRARPREKPDLVKRVAILGDSVTLGDGLRSGEAYPQVLEARMREEGRPVEVMNVALWGWSTRQERIAWQRIARGYRPDAAILAVCLNDIPELHNNLQRPPRWLLALHARFALARLVVDAEGREIDSVERLFTEADSARVERAMAGFFEEVRALRREVEADGARFAVIVFPFRFQVEAGAPAPIVQERVAAFCRDEGLRCLDLLPALASHGESAFSDYDHLSPSGARATAAAVWDAGLLPETEPAAAVLARADGVPLERLLAAPEPSARWAAAWSAGRGGSSGAALRGALAAALRTDPSASVRAEAAVALGAMGDGARAAMPALFDALADPSEAVRHAAARALAALGPAALDQPRLVAALDSPDDFVSAFAAWSLGNMGPAAREAVPALVKALSREETNAVVAGALARLGPAAAEAVPALVEALRSEDADRRFRAARTLGRIGPPAGAATAALAAVLRDPSVEVRQHAARALGRIGPGARSAAAELQRATGDRDESVRQEARQALERVR